MMDKLKALVNRFFKGSRRACPVCKSQFSFFMPLPSTYSKSWKKFGFPYRVNDFETLNAREFSCPVCGSTDRDRLFSLFLDPILPSGSDLSILDIAPSRALSSWVRARRPRNYKTADLFMEGVDLKLDIEDMKGVSDEEFNMVICSHVLEHVPDDRKALSEIFRILCSRGEAILMVPIVKQLKEIAEDPLEEDIPSRWKRFGQDDHIRIYSKTGWVDRVKGAGFDLKEVQATDICNNPSYYGIDPDSILYLAKRP